MATPFTNVTGSVAVSGTEYSLPAAANYSSGSPQTTAIRLQLALDVSAMVAGDTVQVTIYDKANGGTQAPVFQCNLVGTQTRLFTLPERWLKEGWDVTIKLIAGAGSTVKWSLKEGVGDANLVSWLGTAPAALTASGYVQSILLRWLTDNAAGTPAALTTSGYLQSMVLRWLTDSAAGTPAALSTNGYTQSMLRRWLTDDAGGTPNALTSGRVESLVGAMSANVMTAAALATDAVTEIAAAITVPTAADVATAVLAATIHTGYSVARALRIIGGAVAGKMSGVSTDTPVVRFLDDSGNAITGTTTADGRTTAVHGA